METNTVVFTNGVRVRHDLIVGADGIGSAVRRIIGIQPAKRPAESSCLHANVDTEQAVKLGLKDYSVDNAIRTSLSPGRRCRRVNLPHPEYWGGQEGKWDKIVLSPCNGGKLLSYYCFFPREQGDYTNQAWGADDRPVEELLAPYPYLDASVKAHLALGIEIQPWRLWLHDPYPYIQRGGVCLLGDAAHPVRHLSPPPLKPLSRKS
jgi:salicylate hydroxylase